MSRNNLILVAHDRRNGLHWSYVFFNVNADNEWNARYAKDHIRNNRKRTRNRATALLIAHNTQLRKGTEYGVQEIFIKH